MQCYESAYVVCKDEKSIGVYEQLPPEYKEIPVLDYQDKLIIPGLVDLHSHASQYAFRGMGMDLELLKWLEERPFKEEPKFNDPGYGQKAYEIFVDDARKSATTRMCLFATIHNDSTLMLMDLLEASGMMGYVGKVNMDRNAPESLIENTEASLQDTVNWLKQSNKYKRVKPILTPRFYPSCTEALMKGVAALQAEYKIPLQTHLSENSSEVDWVGRLNPKAKSYSEAYYLAGLFGSNGPALMSHCVHMKSPEMNLVKKRGVTLVHCPQANTNLSSGIAPIRKFLDAGIPVGLGTDLSAGYSLSIFRTMAEAIKVSKLYCRLQQSDKAPLTVEEAFFLGTKGGGAFFGKVGSFEPGYEFDAIVIDDHAIRTTLELTAKQRIERVVYLSDERHIAGKFVMGRQIF